MLLVSRSAVGTRGHGLCVCRAADPLEKGGVRILSESNNKDNMFPSPRYPPGQGRWPMTYSYADANGMCRVCDTSSNHSGGETATERLLTLQKTVESDLAHSKEPELVIRLAHGQLVSFIRHFAVTDAGTISRLCRVGEHQPVAVGPALQFPWEAFFVLLSATTQSQQPSQLSDSTTQLLAQTNAIYLGYWSNEQRLVYKHRRWSPRVLSVHPHDITDSKADNSRNNTHQLVWEYMSWPMMVVLYICARAQEHSRAGVDRVDDELHLLLTEILTKCTPAQLSERTYPSGFNMLWMAVASHNPQVLTTVLDYWLKAVPQTVFLDQQIAGVDFWHRVLPITVLSYYDQDQDDQSVLLTLLRHPVLEPCRSLVYLCAPSCQEDDHLTVLEVIRAARDYMIVGLSPPAPSPQHPRTHPFLRPSSQLFRTPPPWPTGSMPYAASYLRNTARPLRLAATVGSVGTAAGQQGAGDHDDQEPPHHEQEPLHDEQEPLHDEQEAAQMPPLRPKPSAQVTHLLGDFLGIDQHPILGTLGFRSHKDTNLLPDRFAHARGIADLFQTTVAYTRERELPIYISWLVDCMNSPSQVAEIVCGFLFDYLASTRLQEQEDELAWRKAAGAISRVMRTNMTVM